MPFITGLTRAEMIAEIDRVTQKHCADAFAADCRVVIRWNVANICFHRYPMTLEYQFIILSPGDAMPRGNGWEIWENHSGRAVGRAI